MEMFSDRTYMDVFQFIHIFIPTLFNDKSSPGWTESRQELHKLSIRNLLIQLILQICTCMPVKRATELLSCLGGCCNNTSFSGVTQAFSGVSARTKMVLCWTNPFGQTPPVCQQIISKKFRQATCMRQLQRHKQ